MNEPDLPQRKIYLLGSVRLDASPVAGEKTTALLAYLALHRAAPHSREALTELFWPDLPAGSARRALSDALYRLRKLLGPDCLIADAGRAGLDPDRVWTDVDAFTSLTASAATADLEKAVGLYAGPLAPEVYADWIGPRRALLHERYLGALDQLGALAETAARPEQALDYYRQAAGADPLHETAQRGIMRSLARLGRLPAALEVYARLKTLLQVELAVSPEPETDALATQIRSEIELRRETADSSVQPPWAGRTAERAAVLVRIEDAIVGRGGALAVEGAAGMGKSRLWAEIAAGARWRGATVLQARANEYPTDLPLDPLAALLQQALSGPRAAQVELLLPGETLTVLGDLYPPWHDRAGTTALPPAQARQRWEKSLREVTRTLAELSPHVLIFEDMQWASAALWDAIAILLAAADHSRLLVGLSYRRPDIERSLGWPRLQEWERLGRLETLTLAPLTVNDVEAMLPDVYRDNAAIVAAVCGGNPFYVTQALFALDHDIPLATAEQILRDRLDALPAQSQTAIAAAAVLGFDVPLPLWSRMVDLDPGALITVAEELAALRLLQPVAGGYAFAHDMIQEAVYGRIEPADRPALHDRGADAWRAVDAGNTHAQAYHLDCAGRLAEAAAAYRAAGQQDMAAFAFLEARDAFERALALWSPAPGPERVATLFDLAQLADNMGDRDRQRAALQEALGAAQQLERDDFVLRALVGLGRLAAITGDMAAAERDLGAATRLVEQVAGGEWRFEAYFYSGDFEARRGCLTAAHTRFEQALSEALMQASPLNEARALRGLSIVSRLNGNLAAALAQTEQALALQLAHGDLFGASVTMTNQLAIFYDMGAWDKLVDLTAEARTLKEELGDRHGVAIVQHMQGLATYSLGDLTQARQSLLAAREGFEAVEDRRTGALARNVLGLVAEASGDLATAERDLRAAIDEARAVGATTETAYAQHDLGALLVESGRLAEAVPLLESAITTWQAGGNDFLRLKSESYLGLALVASDQMRAAQLAGAGWAAFQRGIPAGEMPQAWLWGLYRLLTAVQRQVDAEVVIRTAYAELQRQATAIFDVTQRGHFFERVPLNRAIIRALDEVTGSRRQVTVELARSDAPTGAPLSPGARVLVTWTVAAPEDELIADRAQRRRHVLLRLLGEARAQGAAPTDDDLATALGVSRRTILRDIQTLARMGQSIATRRRK